ncbi:MAG: imidazole glycerol phosphate synthase subunit HisH [Rhodospirillaceae bacterium]|nr:imidazole glycerol phosphate synthase subunit HisH [Rhodospirillaceae bacterium]|tara:strand:+ start:564 stop:1181 length:618 start_codon:yes stop_codon:yes gene_type:complete
MKKKLALINMGIGNINSVFNALVRLNYKPYIVEDGKSLLKYSPTHIILPGVGAVGEALNSLEKKQFIMALNDLVIKKSVFFLGICLGMQILAKTCEEFKVYNALGWIEGNVKRLLNNNLSLPHMGWNTIKISSGNSFLKNINNEDMYFAHTNVMYCEKSVEIGKTYYGTNFTSIVKKKNILGIQSHPEKSGRIGELFLQNFYDQN